MADADQITNETPQQSDVASSQIDFFEKFEQKRRIRIMSQEREFQEREAIIQDQRSKKKKKKDDMEDYSFFVCVSLW